MNASLIAIVAIPAMPRTSRAYRRPIMQIPYTTTPGPSKNISPAPGSGGRVTEDPTAGFVRVHPPRCRARGGPQRPQASGAREAWPAHMHP